jgi:hypothetical protein
MSLEQFLENITIEELEELKKLKELKDNKISTYSFSKIKFSDLKELVDIKQDVINREIFNEWFNSNIELSPEIEEFLINLIKKTEPLIKYYKEEDLKIHFLSHIFGKIDFTSYENNFRDFYNEKIVYKSEKFIFNGEVDFVLAKGLTNSEETYFFIQEFKKEKTISDPEPQLLAELISSVEINSYDSIKGAYIVGTIWNFVILQRVEKHKYIYFVSKNFDSSKIDDLKQIYKNLLFIKNEVIELVKSRV